MPCTIQQYTTFTVLSRAVAINLFTCPPFPLFAVVSRAHVIIGVGLDDDYEKRRSRAVDASERAVTRDRRYSF